MRRHAQPFVFLAILALAACVNETSIPEATSFEAPSAETPPAARPVRVTEFDGRYAGPITLNPDRTRECPRGPAQDRQITVRQGRATLLLNPQTRQTQTGAVGEEGSVRMIDALDRTIATTGQFSDGIFLGEYRNGLCSYSMRMTKRN